MPALTRKKKKEKCRGAAQTAIAEKQHQSKNDETGIERKKKARCSIPIPPQSRSRAENGVTSAKKLRPDEGRARGCARSIATISASREEDRRHVRTRIAAGRWRLPMLGPGRCVPLPRGCPSRCAPQCCGDAAVRVPMAQHHPTPPLFPLVLGCITVARERSSPAAERSVQGEGAGCGGEGRIRCASMEMHRSSCCRVANAIRLRAMASASNGAWRANRVREA